MRPIAPSPTETPSAYGPRVLLALRSLVDSLGIEVLATRTSYNGLLTVKVQSERDVEIVAATVGVEVKHLGNRVYCMRGVSGSLTRFEAVAES